MKKFGEYTEDDVDAIGDKAGNWFKRQSPVGLVLKIIAVFLLLSLLGAGCNYLRSWGNEAGKVISPEHVRKEWQFAYNFDEQLSATATQWCTLAKAEAQETDPSFRSQRTSQRIAVEENYAGIAAQFNAELRDAFRARLIRPRDVPAQAYPLNYYTSTQCARYSNI